MIAYVFPGQGSQHQGMGKDLFDEFPELVDEASNILGYSIKDLCLEDLEGKLDKTEFTQPALYTVNALYYYKKLQESHQKPDFLAGHSLGEYNALLASGYFDFGTGLRIVKKRSELMSQSVGGGMAAVVGLGIDQVTEILNSSGLKNIDVANFNSPSQIVLSGIKEEIESAKPIYEAAGAMFIELKVSGAFHSRLMSQAQDVFSTFLDEFSFTEGSIPVISNVTARPYRFVDLKRNMTEQISCSVNWNDSIRYMMGKGKIDILQVGPGNVLKGLVRKILREAEPLIVVDEEEILESHESIEVNVDKVPTTSLDKDSPQKKKVNTTKEVENKEKIASLQASNNSLKPSQKPKTITQEEDLSAKIQQTALKEPFEEIVIAEYNIDTDSKAQEVVLGSKEFKNDYGIKYAYVVGGMHRGISSKELILKLAASGLLGYYGTSGSKLEQIESDVAALQKRLNSTQRFGVNITFNLNDLSREEELFRIVIKNEVKNIEVSGYFYITPQLVKYRLKGLKRNSDGAVSIPTKILAKVTRPEVAELFLQPAPERLVQKLLEDKQITPLEAELSREIPMVDDLCFESESGWYSESSNTFSFLPILLKLRDEIPYTYQYRKKIRVGVAGGIGTPESAAAAFLMGADFILTGSINQCTVESGTSVAVKEMLQGMEVHDTGLTPQGDLFDAGCKIQVLKKAILFPARANKLYDLYRQHDSLSGIDVKTKKLLEEKYFQKSISSVYEACKTIYSPQEIEKAELNPKYKMALVFRWYFDQAAQFALAGDRDRVLDYQIQVSPALGAFNRWVKGTSLENWKNRNVDVIGITLMDEALSFVKNRYQKWFNQ